MTSPQSPNNQKVVLSLPSLNKFQFEEKGVTWTVSYYDEYKSVLLFDEEDSVLNELKKVLKGSFKNFRKQYIFKSTPFLIGFFFDKNEIRFYTPRLGREFFLVEQIEAGISDSLIREMANSEDFKAFKSYTEEVASLGHKDFPTTYELITHEHKLPDLINDKKFHNLEAGVNLLIDKLLVSLNEYRPVFFERITDFGLGLTAKFALLRIHLLKFLAILPSLDHDTSGHEVKRILLESLRRLLKDSSRAKAARKKGQERPLPKRYILGVKAAHFVSYVIPAGILASSVRFAVRFMAKRFIAGESIETADEALKSLAATGRDVTLDQLGELVVSEREADNYMNEVIKLVKGFSLHVNKGERNEAGINRAHVSIKLSALCSDFKPEAFEYTYKHVSVRLIKILLEALEHDVFINIDAEHYDYRDIVFKIYRKVLLDTKELRDFKATGIVLQAYLRDASIHLEEITLLGKERGIIMPVRLVKGAYWDAETVEADAHSFDAPEFLNKEETDLHFRQLIVQMFEAHPHVQLCLASHNFADHSFAEVLREKYYQRLPVIEHQCLHMTYEALSVGMAKMNWVVRNYVPIGSLIVGMAYLVRRIMENSSQVGVLTIMRSHKKKTHIDSPMKVHTEKKKHGKIFRDLTQASLTSNFFNIPPVRLYLDEQRDAVELALASFKEVGLGKTYSNKFLLTGEKKTIVSSSDTNIKVGEITFANVEDTKQAIDICDQAYNRGEWAKSSWLIRASILLKAADLMLARRNSLSALIVYEAGKSIPEALGDVDEAIDFLTYYARRESRFKSHHPNAISRGLVGVISPWNFPLAIPCGMVAAPLVAGNTVILKSAEQTPLIAAELVDLFYEAGVPHDVLIHLPGEGETVGATLVNDERVASLVFTGSKAVGVLIAHQAGKRIYKNKLFNLEYPVKTVTEMGGKNAVIVTANAELDETVAGILFSSFAHAGQKCSAASRVIVSNDVKNRLVERLTEAIQDIEVSEAFNMSCVVNPVISKEDQERLRRQVVEASAEVEKFGGKVHVNRSAEDLPGYCVGPTLIEIDSIRARDPESFARRELFGPVVHVIGYDGLDDALELYNCTDYALTGGVFSQSQDDIDYLTARMESGNIYVNRSITGARVGIEPFGGFKLSGTGPKAGSKSYIRNFHINPVVIPESDYTLDVGSEYRFDLCRPSGLTAMQRGDRMDKALNFVLHHFESLFQGIHGENKKVLARYRKWIRKNFVNFQTKEHGNRKIPGQLSFNDFNMVGEYTLVTTIRSVPHISTLFNVLSAVVMGSGVTIAARTNESYLWWSTLVNYFRQAGFSKENFDCFLCTEELLVQNLQHPLVNYVIVDGEMSWLKKVSETIYSGDQNELRMKAILTPLDSPALGDFKRFLEQFAWVRAFAVNTMRHGAPLDLEF